MILDITDTELIYCLSLIDYKDIYKDLHYWKREVKKRVIKGYIKNKHDELVYWCVGIADGWIEY